MKRHVIRNCCSFRYVFATTKTNTLQKVFPVFHEVAKLIEPTFAGHYFEVLEELKEQLLDRIQFGRPGSTKNLATFDVFCSFGMQIDIGNKRNSCTACMRTFKSLQYQLSSTGEKTLPALTPPEEKTKSDFS